MAKKIFYSSLSLAKNELLDARIQNVSTSERTALVLGAGHSGFAVWDVDLNSLFIWDVNHWRNINASAAEVIAWNQGYDDSVTGFTVSQGVNTTFTVERRNSANLTATYKSSYEHDQSSPSDTWVITHNLNKRPSVTVLTSSGDEVEGELTVNSLNQITLTFSAAFSGSAILN
jgi:hypothetical protein